MQQFQEFSELWACRHQALCLVLSGIVSWMILSAGYLASPQACLLLSPVVVPNATHIVCAPADATNPTRSQLQGLMAIQQGLPEKRRQRGGRKSWQSQQPGKATHRNKPQPGTVMASPRKLPPLPLERTSQRWRRQVSWLTALAYSLAPSRDELSQWFPQISFRSQLRGATNSHRFPGHISGCDRPFQRCV